MESEKYYQESKHQDDWGVDVIYPNTVKNLIKIAEYEGIILGLKICQELYAQGQVSSRSISETTNFYKGELEDLLEEIKQ